VTFHRLPRAGVVTALVSLALSGCSTAGGEPSEDGPLRAADTNGAAVEIGNSQDSDIWSFGGFYVCVEQVPKSLEIKSIGLIDATGTPAVTGKYYIGADTTDLAPFALPERYAGVGPVDVSRVKVSSCPPGGDVFTVGVEMRSREHWSAKGIRMVYQADGSEFVARWPFPMEVCGVENDPSPLCAEQRTPSTPS
jgi:hypothetical protein